MLILMVVSRKKRQCRQICHSLLVSAYYWVGVIVCGLPHNQTHYGKLRVPHGNEFIIKTVYCVGHSVYYKKLFLESSAKRSIIRKCVNAVH